LYIVFQSSALLAVYAYIATMACQWSADKELDDMTECSICTEVFTDPRVLPCVHTFCLKCLMNYGKDRQVPGDVLPCPLCRKVFTIPDDGLSGIQKNFFMEKLIRVRKLSALQEAHQITCDICSSDESRANNESAKPASVYCVQCRQNYCDQCSQHHKRMRSSSSHTQVGIDEEDLTEILISISPAMCKQHRNEEIKVFCQDCKVAVCKMCYITSHETHGCSDIETLSRDLRKLVVTDTDKISEGIQKTGEVLPCLEKEKKELIEHLTEVQVEINTAADKLIEAVQRDRAKLLSKVEMIKLKRLKLLETAKQEVEQHMTALESLKRYSETLLSSGTDCDVTRSANSLHDRAGELMTFDVVGHVANALPLLRVRFSSSQLLDNDDDDGNLVGTIDEGRLDARNVFYYCLSLKLPKVP